jgi:hypothetical protein
MAKRSFDADVYTNDVLTPFIQLDLLEQFLKPAPHRFVNLGSVRTEE